MMTLNELMAAKGGISAHWSAAKMSWFRDAWGKVPDGTVTVAGLVRRVRSAEWEPVVADLRRRLERGDRNGYDQAKKSLPAVAVSAELSSRRAEIPLEERVVAHSGWLQLDIDAKDNPLELEEVRELLQADPHVGAVFLSPSGQGVKGLMRIDGERHRESFLAAEAHWLERGLRIDKACKDVTRLCFVSHDPEAWLAEKEPEVLPIPEREERAPVGEYHPPLETDAADIEEMLSFIAPRPTYEDWLRIASAVWSVLPLEPGVRLLNKWSPEETPGEYAEKWRHRLKQVQIGTLVWYAQQGGFDARAAAARKRWAGRIRFAERAVAAAPESAPPPEEEMPPVEIPGEQVWQCLQEQQLGDAKLFSLLSRGEACYDVKLRAWRRYRDGCWERDDLQTMWTEFSEKLAREYSRKAALVEADLKERPAPAEETRNDSRIREKKMLGARIEKLHTTGWSAGALKFAQSLPSFARQAPEFDRSPALLAVENGVVDFDEGIFRPWHRQDLLSARAPVMFEEGAKCPSFDAFLHLCLGGDKELVDYVWRAIGYSLTGYVEQDVLFFCHGKGANGKSTFHAALSMLLGGRLMTTIDVDTLMSKRGDSSTLDYKKATLEGKRVVVTDELPEGRKLNESMVKAIVGGDSIVARRPYEEPYIFEPTHKVWMVGNHKPRITGTDMGIWRRIHLIPWTTTIPLEERRPRHEVLADFRRELPGILWKALLGWEDMRRRGQRLDPPAVVQDAVDEYRAEEDQVGQFLEECTVKETLAEVPVTTLLKVYHEWCDDQGEVPAKRSNKALIADLKERGMSIHQGHRKLKSVAGFRLIDTEMGSKYESQEHGELEYEESF